MGLCAWSEHRISILPPDIYLDWSHNFEVIEVNSNLGSPSLFTEEGAQALAEMALENPDSVPNFADYFALLGSGLDVVATGNSDSTEQINIGYPRSFVRIDANGFEPMIMTSVLLYGNKGLPWDKDALWYLNTKTIATGKGEST